MYTNSCWRGTRAASKINYYISSSKPRKQQHDGASPLATVISNVYECVCVCVQIAQGQKVFNNFCGS